MSSPPLYPVHLARLESWSKGTLGNAEFRSLGWSFRFVDGALTVAEPDGICVIRLDRTDTERFVDLVLALDAGRTDAFYAPKEERPA